MKKLGIITTVIVFAAALVVGCMQPLDGSGFGAASTVTASEGNFRIIIGGGGARTLMPTFESAAQFLAIFSDGTNNDPYVVVPISSSIAPSDAYNGTVSLVGVRSYSSVKLYAFREAQTFSSTPTTAEVNTAIAAAMAYAQQTFTTGTIDVAVDNAITGVTYVELDLEWIPDASHIAGAATDKGTFTYNIGLSGSISVASLTLTPLGTTTANAFTGVPNIKTTGANVNTTGEALNIGAYSVTVMMTHLNGNTAYFRQVLQIYKGLVSDWTAQFPGDGYFGVDGFTFIGNMPDPDADLLGTSATVTPPVTFSGATNLVTFPATTTVANIATLTVAHSDVAYAGNYTWYVSSSAAPLATTGNSLLISPDQFRDGGIYYNGSSIYEFYIMSDDFFSATISVKIE